MKIDHAKLVGSGMVTGIAPAFFGVVVLSRRNSTRASWEK